MDTDALVAALHAGRLGGAGLDVFDTEPLPPGHPILACEQVVLTPHNADQTPEGMDLLNAGVVDNVIAFLEGTAPERRRIARRQAPARSARRPGDPDSSAPDVWQAPG